MPFRIRPYHRDDCAACRAVFVQSVREGTAKHYTLEQRAVWAPLGPPTPAFCKKLEDQQVFVATHDGEIIGFMSLTSAGYLDLAFVLPRWMGRSVAQTLYERLAQWAKNHRLRHLSTHASHFARPFFARNGWTVDHPETVSRDGQSFERFAMSIDLETSK